MSAACRAGIVADDLTSAADGAGPFVAAGLACAVGCRGHVPTEGAVRSVDTGSRGLDAAGAARAVRAATAALAGCALLYKTVDSTLRGHVAVELAAALEASGRRGAVLAPAFPAAGRTTVGGVQRVDGVRLDDTPYARDPVHPARTARLAELVDPALGEPLLVHARDGWPAHVGARALLVDVELQDELDRFVAEAPDPGDWLWVGSPGMARALAARCAGEAAAPVPAAPQTSGARRVLLAIGSLNPTSRRQVARLRARGVPVVGPGEEPPEGAPALCLVTPAERLPDAAGAAEALAARAAALLAEGRFDALVASGGETLEHVLRRLGVEGFALVGELAPGFPVGRVAAPLPLLIAMKAGGFGGDEALVDALRLLTAEAPA